MANAFTWLNDLMVWLGRWFPRPILVRASHEGVRFGMGGSVVRLQPGVHFYWPIVQEVQLVSLALRTMETAAQVNDGQLVSTVITYRVVDSVKVIRDMYDFAAQIDMRTKAHMANGSLSVDAQLAELFREFDPLGIRVEGVAITQRSWCVPLKTLTDWAMHEARSAK